MRAWWGRRTAARCWGSRAGRPWPESAGDSCRRRDGWCLVWVKVCRSRRFWASLHSRAERGDFSPPLSLTCSAKGRPRPVAKRVDGGYVDLGSEPALWLGSIPRGYQETQTSYDSKTTDSSGPFCAVYFCTVRRRDLPPASGRETGEAIAEDRRMDPGRGSSFGDDVGRAVCIYAGRKEKQRTLRFWQTRLVAPREPGRRRQVSLGLVTMAETIQKEMSCFPGETGSSRIFDDKTVQGLDKRRRSKQKGLDTKRQQQQPRSYLSYPNNPTTNTPNATNLSPPPRTSPVIDGDAYDKENQVTRVAASLPPSPQPVSCNIISPFALSPSGTMQIAPVAVPRATISAPRLRLRASTPTQIIPDTVDSTLAWQTQVIPPSHAQQEALCPPRR